MFYPMMRSSTNVYQGGITINFIEFSSDSSYGRCYPSDLDKYESTFIIDVDTNNKIKNIEMIFDPVYCEMV